MCYFDLEVEGSANGAGGRGHTAMFPNEALRVMQHIFSRQGVWSSGWSVKIDFLLLLPLLLITTREGGGGVFISRFPFREPRARLVSRSCVLDSKRGGGETIDTHLTPLQVCWDSGKRTWRSNS